MTSLDCIVGARIKARRLELGMTQTQLADLISVRFQQVQKYENGQNRVAASRLWHISEALDVPVSYFFDSVSDQDQPSRAVQKENKRKRELFHLFDSLNEAQQNAVMSFLRSVSG